MINYELGALIGLFAFVYSYLLTRPHALLNKFYNKCDVYFETDKRSAQGKPMHPLFMILIHCEKCIAGQIALWLGFGERWFNYIFWNEHTLDNALTHILFIAYAIFCAAVIKGLYTKHIES